VTLPTTDRVPLRLPVAHDEQVRGGHEVSKLAAGGRGNRATARPASTDEPPRQYPRRIEIEGQRGDVRTNFAWVGGIGVVAGIGVVLAGPSPTGSTVVDTLLLIVVVAACIFCIATAPWLRRWNETPRPIITAAILGIAVQILARLGNVRYFGVTSAFAIIPVLALTLIAIQRRTGQRRVQLWSVFGGLVAAAILALIGFGVAAAAARPDLMRGTDEAERALDSLKAGDLDTARHGFDIAAGLLENAKDDLDALWAQPARLLPVVAQHRRAAADLAESATSVSSTISGVLAEVDFDKLRIVNGTIDVAAITALQDPLQRLVTALDDLDSTVTSVHSGWLVQPVSSRLSTLSEQVENQLVEGERAARAVELAPDMLGATGKRVYFIAFTTPSEARGLGGFMGTWAELSIDAGHFSISAVGRTADLAVDGDTEHWLRITGSPHFPDVASAIADGYPAYSGHPVDGVIAMDVDTVAALMELTGPIDLTTIPQAISADNAAKFLLSDQYVLAPAGTEMLEEAAGTTIARLLSSSLPAPPDLVDLLSPYAAQGRLIGWSSRAVEEDLFDRMHMAGKLPELNGGDGLGVVIDNMGGNKIDYYLTGEVSYLVETDEPSGTGAGTLIITLHNGAPPGVTEPATVFGNTVGAPPGTNAMQLHVYSAMPVTAVTVDGASRAVDLVSKDHGFEVSTLNLQIPGQSTTQIKVQLAGPLDLTDGYHLVLRNAPAVKPMETELVVDEDIVEDLGAQAGIYSFGA
jgi:Protein of unknown function (DUF4012)